MRAHRRQPTRLPHPWDSSGKNIGVGCHFLLQCMKVKNESEVTQLTLCDPMDCSPPGSSIHGIFQARVLEWGAIPFSRTTAIRPQLVRRRMGSWGTTGNSEEKVLWDGRRRICHKASVSFKVMFDFVTPWTVAQHVPLSTEFPRKEHWHG